jgi:hypothetical protein
MTPLGRLHLLPSKLAVFIAIHCLENSLVSRLKLWQLDGPITIAVHQSEYHASMMPNADQQQTQGTPGHDGSMGQDGMMCGMMGQGGMMGRGMMSRGMMGQGGMGPPGGMAVSARFAGAP